MSKNQELPHSQNYHKQHPTDFIHGLLSSHVYTDSKEGDSIQFIANTNNADHQYNELLKDWRVHKIYNEPQSDNYYGVLYVNDTAKQAVLAHRGTDIIASLKGQNGSLKADLIEVLNGNIVLQQTEAYTSTKDAVDIVNDKQYNLSFTGHSLGAWLAELSLYFCHMDFSYDISVGYVKAVTFDSPGTKNQMESYKSSINNKDTKIEISEFDVVTYLSAPNLVNVCNEHVGKVYRLFPEISPQSEIFVKVAEKLPSYISNNKVYLDALLAISGHSLDPMLATFDSSTGTPKPTHYREVLNWPIIQHKSSQSNYTQTSVQTVIDSVPATSYMPSVLSAAKAAISKLMTTTTYGSLATVIYEFSSGNIRLAQLFATYRYLDITTHQRGYPVKEYLTVKENFSLTYKGHYRLDPNEVDHKKASISQTKGTLEWYLMKLSKYSEVDIKSKLSVSESEVNQLLALKKQYVIGPPNSKGMRVIISKSTNVEDLKDQMSSLIKSDTIKNALGTVQSETLIEKIILAMQEEAAEWVKICSANNVIKEEGESNHKFVNKIEKLVTRLSEKGINNYFMSNDVSTDHLLNSLYSMQALANYYMYNKHNNGMDLPYIQNEKQMLIF